jgi:hypothetical protein
VSDAEHRPFRRGEKGAAGKVVARAATGTLNLAVAGAGAVGTALTGSWLVAAMGGIAYLALVAWDVANPEFWKRVLARKPPESILPEAKRFKNPEIAQAMAALHRGRADLARVMLEVPEQVQNYMGLALTSMTELEGHAVRLAERGDEMGSYLASVDPQAIRTAIRRLSEQAERSRDAEARAQFEEARRAKEDQLRTLDELTQAQERVLANLSRIVATVEGLPAKVMKMQVLDARAIDSISGNLNTELDRMNGEIRAFEETLAEIPIGVRA